MSTARKDLSELLRGPCGIWVLEDIGALMVQRT